MNKTIKIKYFLSTTLICIALLVFINSHSTLAMAQVLFLVIISTILSGKNLYNQIKTKYFNKNNIIYLNKSHFHLHSVDDQYHSMLPRSDDLRYEDEKVIDLFVERMSKFYPNKVIKFKHKKKTI